jgi:hypothetical protein
MEKFHENPGIRPRHPKYPTTITYRKMGWGDTVNLLENFLMEVRGSPTLEFPNMAGTPHPSNFLSAGQG